MNQVAKTENKAMTIKDRFQTEAVAVRLAQAIGSQERAERFISNILLEIQRNPSLSQCTHSSVVECAIDAANFNLTPNKLSGHAYLIPLNNSKKVNGEWIKELECTLQIGYKGYISKFADEGYSVEVELVTKREMEENRFHEVRGTSPAIEHNPIRDESLRVRDNIALAYAVANKIGMPPVFVVMTQKEIESAVKYEKANAGGAWKKNDRETDYAEMCKKTVVRRLAKSCPISIINEMSAFEGEHEEKVLKDVTPDPVEKPESKMSHIVTETVDQDGVVEGEAQEVAEPAKASEEAPIEQEASNAPDTIELCIENSKGEWVWTDKAFETAFHAAKYMETVMKNRKRKVSRQNLFKKNVHIQNMLISENNMKPLDDLAKLITDGADG